MAGQRDREPSVFVYGTLMPGEARWPALRPFAVSWRPATARGQLWDTGRGYPAVRFDPAGGPVPGMVVTIAPRLLDRVVSALDAIEGEGVLYRRMEVVTTAGPAISYEWIGPTLGLKALPHGWPRSSGR